MKRTYTVAGREIALEVDDSAVAVRFNDGTPTSQRARSLAEAETQPFESRFELPKEPYTIIPLTRQAAGAGRAEAAARIGEAEEVERVAEVYRLGAKRAVATERVSFGMTDGAPLEDVLDSYGMKLVESFGDDEHLAQVSPDTDPIEVVNLLAADHRVRYAEPDLVLFGRHIARRPLDPLPDRPRAIMRTSQPDPYLPDQYALFITEADLARQQVRGDPEIRIAILDEGVDVGHPDLMDAVVGLFDATDNDEWQEPYPWDAHGTACAGLAAALGDNGRGIVGIGGGASILAVRIAFSRYPRGRWVTADSWIRRAIDWSVKQGADVISNSWGGGVYSHTIRNAIERARTLGRDGRGAVVVAAAGNEGTAVDFPGYLEGVLTVSASNQYDEFKTRTSLDGETGWGSNFGAQIDVAAPGVGNLTTDIRSSYGYDRTDYTLFNGTSSSTPLVAGACALLLSSDPDLTEEMVRDAIRAGADKVGQYPYTDGRNDQMGHGRLNVRRALDIVRAGLLH